MIREGSNPLHDNLAAALLFRPAPAILRDIPLEDDEDIAGSGRMTGSKNVISKYEVLDFIASKPGCNIHDVMDYFNCSNRIATNHLCRLHMDELVIRHGAKRHFTYEAIK